MNSCILEKRLLVYFLAGLPGVPLAAACWEVGSSTDLNRIFLLPAAPRAAPVGSEAR